MKVQLNKLSLDAIGDKHIFFSIEIKYKRLFCKKVTKKIDCFRSKNSSFSKELVSGRQLSDKLNNYDLDNSLNALIEKVINDPKQYNNPPKVIYQRK